MTERYGPEPTPTDDTDTGSVHFPIPEETIDAAVVPKSDLQPVDAASVPEQPADNESVIQTDLEPIVAAESAAETTVDTDPAPVHPADHPAHGPAGHGDAATEVDPYAGAPEWVRAHIPRGPLMIPERTRGGLKSAISRARTTRLAPAAAPAAAAVEVVEETTARPVTDSASAAATVRPDRSRTWMLVGGGVAVLAVVSAAVVTAMTGTTDEPQVPPLRSPTVVSSSTITTSTTASAAPGWCAPVTESDRVVGNGPGGRDTGPAVIQAFEHAYYVERDGKAVADLMVLPGSDIQSFIDAVPVGTEHCVSVLPTEDPNRWSVDVLLKFPPVGDEGIHRQWITTLPADGGLKIANVENR
ncbi:hypothetical protein OCS65_28225 (plasmid) [Rhodococcus aetherivorans]|uniref:DUF8176 domain-containing protein n=1 Tax=Rhodococcus aetherivorans TaxID=191292 RepID=A0AA46NZ12_9NOCA|nr:hypothetical protein [Rhodococcus aetherivorans]UYF97199.1 hypothetical protein OCS65_28225 [Rhodococcus aetherivorans]